MNRKLAAVYLFLACALSSGSILSGCAKLDPEGVYQGNRVLYDADMLIATSFETVHGFVTWEHNNRTALSAVPRIKEYADSLRQQYPAWHKAAIAARETYANAPNVANEKVLDQALVFLRAAMNQAQKLLSDGPATTISAEAPEA